MEHESTATPRPVRILHLEDSKPDSDLIALKLKSTLYPCTITFVQTEDAYRAALERKDFDVILSDYRMPAFDGDQALALARQKCPDIPFIMVTGELGEDLAIETLKRGATDYVLKDNLKRLLPAVRRALEEAAQLSKRRHVEQMLEMFADTIPGLMVVYSPQNRTDSYVNRAWHEFTGLTLDEVWERGWHTMIHADDLQRLRDAWPGFQVNNSAFHIDLRIRRYDGVFRWFEMTGTPMRDEKGNVVRWVAIGIDVTEQRDAEAALRRSEERFSKVFYSAPFGIAIIRMSDGRILEVNRAWEADSGYMRSEAIGKTPDELGMVGIDDEGPALKMGLPGPGESRNRELRFKRKNGSIGWGTFSFETIDLHGEQCLLAIGADITQLKQVEEDLRRSEERFSKAFHLSPFPMSISEKETGRFIDVNDCFLQSFGVTREEVIGKISMETGIWVSQDDRKRYVGRLIEQGSVQNMEMTYVRRNGLPLRVLSSSVFVTLDGRERILTVAAEIPMEKHLSREKTRQLQQLSRQKHKLDPMDSPPAKEPGQPG